METHLARKTPPRRRSGGKAALVSALVVLALVVLWLSRRTTDGAAAKPPPAPMAKGPSAHAVYRSRALVAPPPDPGAPTGTVITGTVYTTDGAPIADAAVVATTFQTAGNLLSTAGSARSDARGRFELALPDGTYQVTASKAGYGPTFALAHSGGAVSLVLPQSGAVTGHVYDERHRPVRRFTIAVVSPVPEVVPAPPALGSQTFDSPDGSFSLADLPAWPVILKATADEYAPGFSASLDVKPGQKEEVELALSRGCTLTGTVEDRDGTRLPQVLVNAESRLAAGSSSDLGISAAEAVQQAQSEADGGFRLEHVPLGEIRIRAYDGSNAVTTLSAKLTDCERLDPVKIVMSPGGSVAGVARAASGEPIAGARLLLHARSTGFVAATTDAEGRFRLDDLPTGMARLELRSGDRATMRAVRVKEGEVTELDLALYEAGKGEIRGRVTAGDKPLSGMRLMVTGKNGEKGGSSAYYPVTGEDGGYRVPALPDGGYVITVLSTMHGKVVYVTDGRATEANIDVAMRSPSEDTN